MCPPERYVESPKPQYFKTTLFLKKNVIANLVRIRSCWNRVGAPSSLKKRADAERTPSEDHEQTPCKGGTGDWSRVAASQRAPSTATKSHRKRQARRLPQKLQREHCSADTLDLNFKHPELLDHKFLLF